jgi:hypothetical protein
LLVACIEVAQVNGFQKRIVADAMVADKSGRPLMESKARVLLFFFVPGALTQLLTGDDYALLQTNKQNKQADNQE